LGGQDGEQTGQKEVLKQGDALPPSAEAKQDEDEGVK
jgi:hypothetical protein